MTGTARQPAGFSASETREVKTTTCDMCACRCGIKVHLQDGVIRYIQGNRDHPINRGVLCGRGSAGIMHQYSPARLRKPLRRVGERGSGEFKEIEWEEALDLATGWLAHIRATDPHKLAFFTGRDQSQALTGWWAQQFGTPNYAAHGGFCSVNMAAAGLYTLGGSFWEFSEPDWEHTEYFMLFGVAEDHASNPIKIGLAKLKDRGVKTVAINPVRTGYSAVADEWIGITPGTDGLFVLALVHELLRAGMVDIEYLSRYSNASWLVLDDPEGEEDGLLARDGLGRPLCWDLRRNEPARALERGAFAALKGSYALRDGRRGRPVFHLLAERYLDAKYSPDAVAERTGVAASTIRRIAAELADAAFKRAVVLDIPWTDSFGRHHPRTLGRPVSVHAMRGIAAHTNGFHTCRAIHLLQILLASIDVPGGMRHKPPYPKSLTSLPRPTGQAEDVTPNRPLRGPHLGFPTWPQHLLVDAAGRPQRIDKAFSWDAPLAAHGLMHAVITNAWKGDPYPIDTLFMYMANMAWNSAMNTADTIAMLTDRDPATGQYRIPHIIYADAFASETVAYADLVLPDTTYLERWDCISLLDRPISDADAAGDAIRQPVLTPHRDVRPFQNVLLDLGARLGLAGMVDDQGRPKFAGGYADYLVHHERRPGIGMLAGWRGVAGDASGRGPANPTQLEAYIANGCFWREELPANQRYYRNVNRDYLEHAFQRGFVSNRDPIVVNLYSEELQRFRLAARGHGPCVPPEKDRPRIERYFDPLPFWYPPFGEDAADAETFPIHAITQRPMAMYHSWGGHNAWLRQIHGDDRLYVSDHLAADLGLQDGDWVRVTSRHGTITVQVRLSASVNARTVWTWNGIGKRRGSWNLDPDASEATKGFLLNHLIDDLFPPDDGGYRYSKSDPVTGQAAWYDLKVRVEKAAAAGDVIEPGFPVVQPLVGLPRPPAVSRHGAEFRRGR